MSAIVSVQELTPRDRRGLVGRWRVTYAGGRTVETDGHVADPTWQDILFWVRAGGATTPMSAAQADWARARDAALAELAELDRAIPRGLEDGWSAQGFDTGSLPEIQRERLERKAALRALVAAPMPTGEDA